MKTLRHTFLAAGALPRPIPDAGRACPRTVRMGAAASALQQLELEQQLCHIHLRRDGVFLRERRARRVLRRRFR